MKDQENLIEKEYKPGLLYLYFGLRPSYLPNSDQLELILSKQEQLRSLNYKSEEAKLDFVWGRILLRRILSAHQNNVKPKQWTICTDKSGKPFQQQELSLHFNLSHSHKMLLLGVSTFGPIGVDVERLDRNIPILQLARRFFHPEETKVLESTLGSDLNTRFFSYWTQKEAYLKLTGEGLPGGLGSQPLRHLQERNKVYFESITHQLYTLSIALHSPPPFKPIWKLIDDAFYSPIE